MASNGYDADDASIQPRYVISGYGQDDDDVFYIIMAIMHTLNEHNFRSPRVTKKMVRLFAELVFHEWDTDIPIPVPPPTPPQPRLDQCRLRFGTILIDSPLLVPMGDFETEPYLLLPFEAPTYRRAGQPAFLQCLADEFVPHRVGHGYVWTDSLGDKLPWLAVVIDPGLDIQPAYQMVQMHYDRNEHKRIIDWNTDRAIYWARQRLLNFARELNGDFSCVNGNRYQCADEYVHPLHRAKLCRHIIEDLHLNIERGRPEFVWGVAIWGWLKPASEDRFWSTE